MGVQAMLIICVLFIATAETQSAEANIEFWREDVTLTCPESDSVKWYKEGKELNTTEETTYTVPYDDKISKLHSCTYGDENKRYYFFMKGKVCKNCFELDASLFGLVIVLDVIGTAIVMMIIYKCTKKKGSAGPVRSSKAPSHSGGPAPPTPSRDYEQLNVHTRNQDTYSIVNRTG